MRQTILALTLVAAAPLCAQQVDNQNKQLNCEDNRSGRSDQERFCEMREFPAGAVGRISIDGRTNGGISVKGWSRNDVLIRAKVDAWAPTMQEARTIASQVQVQTGANIRADAPEFGRERGWAVSYEVFVPHRSDLTLKAHNGGIRIADVSGDIGFEALNGGVTLARLGGNVKGKTTNGGLKIDLAGSRWEGNELNVTATNGGVSMDVPSNYSARLETGTVNGRVSIDFPVTVQGKIDREVSVTLGGGGPLIRAYTTNGGVTVRRKS